MAMLSFAPLMAPGLNMPMSRMGMRSASRVTGLRMIELEESGEFGTTDYTMTFKEGGKVISPWHDVPLELDGGLYNMLTEIPKMTLKKMEVDTKACGSPGRWV